MSDPAHLALAQRLATLPPDTLWLADEAMPVALIRALGQRPDITVLSQRLDVVRALEAAGARVRFDDFAIAGQAPAVVARVAKDKALTHHLINLAAAVLPEGGECTLAGLKNEGAKTYTAKAEQVIGPAIDREVAGNGLRLAVLRRDTRIVATLDDKDYARLRPVAEADGFVFWSKPGVFGWDSVDAGSALLAHSLAEHGGLRGQVVDLGCGYGYLTAQAVRLGAERVTATDNNAAAIDACTRTVAENRLPADVLADDCGADLPAGMADWVVCNPPFHRGFATDDGLTDRFLRAAQRILKPRGTAVFVVNRFIPLGTAAAKAFAQVDTWHDDGRFRVIACGRPARMPR